MISEKQKIAARLNGARSRGPVTPQGKKNSSMNAWRHGLLARDVVVGNESREEFQEMLDDHVFWLKPVGAVELTMVEELVAVKWRQQRAVAIEDEWMQQELDTQEPGDERARIAAALEGMEQKNHLNLVNRYESRLYRMYHRSLKSFLLLKKIQNLPNEPGNGLKIKDRP